MHGCHICKPPENIPVIENVLTLKHYNYLSEEYIIKRLQRYPSRMCRRDIEAQWGWQYLQPEETQRLWYRDLFARAVVL